MTDGFDTNVTPKDLADYMLGHGMPVVTVAEAATLLGQSMGNAATSLHRLRRRGMLFRPARGLYVVIPPEYRTWGAVPALDFVDPLMKFLKRRYYVGLLSAAELWGASHQRPQVFQILVDGDIRDRDFGRVRMRFYESAQVKSAETVAKNTRTGQAAVSSPARTCLDLCDWVNESGGISNVATVAAELVEQHRIPANEFINLAASYPAVVLRRLGYALEMAAAQGTAVGLDLDALAAAANPDPGGRTHVVLDAGAPRRGPVNDRWGLIINGDIEVDL
jgi:predicted transcriptional regulator of viral defense system